MDPLGGAKRLAGQGQWKTPETPAFDILESLPMGAPYPEPVYAPAPASVPTYSPRALAPEPAYSPAPGPEPGFSPASNPGPDGMWGRPLPPSKSVGVFHARDTHGFAEEFRTMPTLKRSRQGSSSCPDFLAAAPPMLPQAAPPAGRATSAVPRSLDPAPHSIVARILANRQARKDLPRARALSTPRRGGPKSKSPEAGLDGADKKARRLARNRAAARARREKRRIRMEHLKARVERLNAMLHLCSKPEVVARAPSDVEHVAVFSLRDDEPEWEGELHAQERHMDRQSKAHFSMRCQLVDNDAVRQSHFLNNELLLMVAQASQFGTSNPVLRELVDVMRLEPSQVQRILDMTAAVALETNEMTALGTAVVAATSSNEVMVSSDPTLPTQLRFMHFPITTIMADVLKRTGLSPEQRAALMVWGVDNTAVIDDLNVPAPSPSPDMPMPASMARYPEWAPHPVALPPTATDRRPPAHTGSPALAAVAAGGTRAQQNAAAGTLHTSLSGDFALLLHSSPHTRPGMSPLTPDLDLNLGAPALTTVPTARTTTDMPPPPIPARAASPSQFLS